MATSVREIAPTRVGAGTFTVRDAALFLRSTTPPPEMPVSLWKTHRRRPFTASTRALYSWVRLGMEWTAPTPVSSRDRVISFEDLIRLRMIALFRARGFRYRTIREAEEYARSLTGARQPFVTEELWTGFSAVLLKFTDRLVAISRQGQLALPHLQECLEPANHGLVFDRDGVAERWSTAPGIMVDPGVQFGAPCLQGTRIETATLWSMHSAGDSRESLARAFAIPIDGVEAALDWERILTLAE